MSETESQVGAGQPDTELANPCMWGHTNAPDGRCMWGHGEPGWLGEAEAEYDRQMAEEKAFLSVGQRRRLRRG